jgi:predicted Rossmann fold nucleotide-binding protein DprA/Smf involved in DNA uptake
LYPAERESWEKAAAQNHKELSNFIRDAVNREIFRHHVDRADVDLGPVLQELKDLQDLITKRDDLFDLNLQMQKENAAALNITDIPLEEKILTQLGNRSFFTNQLIEFTGAEAGILIAILARLQKENKITQTIQGKWKKVDS